MIFRNQVCLCLFLLIILPIKADPINLHKSYSSSWKDRSFQWYYNPSNAPSWLSPQFAKSIVFQAAQSWEICGIFMIYMGETERISGSMDRKNVVGWSPLKIPKLRGLTVGQAKDGFFFERDILINPNRQEFQRYPGLLQKVITHEFGHALGLIHSSRCDDVMTLAANCTGLDPENLPLMPTSRDLAQCFAIYPPL